MFEYTASKDYLARLLANENINVVRSAEANTAWFDLKNRTMTLPVWKCSEVVYDLLTLHEISHALHTPEEGWHDAVAVEGLPKSYLNIIEDARIERLITRRYAGAGRAMRDGYAEINERDVFGLVKNNLNVNELPLIDRINLHYKLGNHLVVPFSLEERVWLDKIDKVDTWEEVVAVCKELYASEKAKKEEKKEDKKEQENSVPEGSQSESTDDSSVEAQGDGEENDESSDHESFTESETNGDPLDSITDNEYRENFEKLEQELVDQESQIKYITLGKQNSDEFVYSVERVRKFIPSEVTTGMLEVTRKLMTEQNSMVNNMVKEFEAKKRASSVARQQYAKTGRLDVKKVHKYQLSEDIFRRNLIQNQGKNHGMVMLFDWSGSMNNKIFETFVQTMVLAMFCRKAKIPFSVQLFTNNCYAFDNDVAREKQIKNAHEFTVRHGNMNLVEMLNSQSSEQDFNKDVANFLFVVLSNANRNKIEEELRSVYQNVFSKNWDKTYQVRNAFVTGSTPLNTSLYLMDDYIAKFKKKHNVEIMNLVVMTDGASDTHSISGREVTVFDKVSGKIYKSEKWSNRNLETNVMYDMLRTRHGEYLNIIGFFVASPQELKYSRFQYDRNAQFSNKNGSIYVVKNNPNMTAHRFFLVPTKAIEIENEWDMEVTDETKVSAVKSSFKKHMNGKRDSRVFVSKFVESIAQKL